MWDIRDTIVLCLPDLLGKVNKGRERDPGSNVYLRETKLL